MYHRILLRLAAPILPLFLCISTATAQSSHSVADIRLRPGDVVRIAAKEAPSLGGEFQVGRQGNILVPELGLISVAGRPFSEVRAVLEAEYATELIDPVLLITPLVRIAVTGEVRRPGLFPVDPTHSIGDVIATVGGMTPRADEDEVVLVRDGERIEIVMEPGSPSLEQRVQSGDRLIVGRWSWFRENLAIFVSAAASVAAAAVTTLIIQ